jgi:hypothetical protein
MEFSLLPVSYGARLMADAIVALDGVVNLEASNIFIRVGARREYYHIESLSHRIFIRGFM